MTPGSRVHQILEGDRHLLSGPIRCPAQSAGSSPADPSRTLSRSRSKPCPRSAEQPQQRVLLRRLRWVVTPAALIFDIDNEARPGLFSSIPISMWSGIVTRTTIGYRDMAPVTVEDRMLGSLVAVLGIDMLLLPADLLGGTFVHERAKVHHRSRNERIAGSRPQHRLRHSTSCQHSRINADSRP